ncbi:hypothetical protein ADUPG1_003986, partial [Aduncisulcus paluster]
APMCVYCGKNDHFVWSCSEYMSPDMTRKLVNAERWRVYAATLDDCDMRDERAELEDFRCDIRREEEFARGRGHTPDDYLVKPESRERAPRGRQRSHRDSAPPRDRAPPRDGAPPQDRPANWQPLKRVQCYRCGGYGHFAKHCDGTPLPPAEQSKLKREIWERSKALRPYFVDVVEAALAGVVRLVHPRDRVTDPIIYLGLKSDDWWDEAYRVAELELEKAGTRGTTNTLWGVPDGQRQQRISEVYEPLIYSMKRRVRPVSPPVVRIVQYEGEKRPSCVFPSATEREVNDETVDPPPEFGPHIDEAD